MIDCIFCKSENYTTFVVLIANLHYAGESLQSRSVATGRLCCSIQMFHYFRDMSYLISKEPSVSNNIIFIVCPFAFSLPAG